MAGGLARPNANWPITAVVDPLGKKVLYQYSAQGDLVAVTDRDGNTTQFVYGQKRPHYLDQVIDPLGLGEKEVVSS